MPGCEEAARNVDPTDLVSCQAGRIGRAALEVPPHRADDRSPGAAALRRDQGGPHLLRVLRAPRGGVTGADLRVLASVVLAILGQQDGLAEADGLRGDLDHFIIEQILDGKSYKEIMEVTE